MSAMQAITSGDYDRQVQGTAARDEVGAMARAVEVFRESAIAKRASGLPRKADVIAALGQVIEPGPSTRPTSLVDNTGNSTNGIYMESGSDSRSEAE